MNRNHPVVNIIKLILFFVVACVLISAALGLLSGVVWLALKIILPIAIVVWLFRWITGSRDSRRY